MDGAEKKTYRLEPVGTRAAMSGGSADGALWGDLVPGAQVHTKCDQSARSCMSSGWRWTGARRCTSRWVPGVQMRSGKVAGGRLGQLGQRGTCRRSDCFGAACLTSWLAREAPVGHAKT